MPPLTNMQTRDIENLLHPTTNLAIHRQEGPLFIERGEGVFVYGADGKRYIEGLAGLWCVGLGFGNKEMAAAAKETLETLSFAHLFGSRSHDGAVELAEKIKEMLPANMAQVFFACSGGEANDTQIKLAWYVSNARGEPRRKKILARRNGYHGLTIVAGSATGIPRFHTDFDLPLSPFVHLTAPHYWKESLPGESEAEFTARLADELVETIEREGPETIAAFIAEPVIGAGGVIIPPKGYFPAFNEVLQRYGISFIDDEVICGFGRTGNWFGAETYGMQPTSFSLAKQLTSAYAPLSAVVINRETADILEAQSHKLGLFAHGFTYGGHPLGTTLALKAIEIYERDRIVDHVRSVSPRFHSLARQLADHPLVGEVRADGNGLIAGFELAADPAARRPFQPVGQVGDRAMRNALARGLIVRPIGDTVAICPPMIITEAEIDEMFDSLRGALDDTLDWVSRNNLAAA